MDLLYGRELTRPGLEWTRRVFTTLLGVVYFAAFLSLWSQVDALLGSGGIAPAAELLERVDARIGIDGWKVVPSLLWFGSSDAAIHLWCWVGIAASVMLAIGIAPRIAAIVAWLAYLSFVAVGDVFLGYQWDALLLETGLLAIFFAPGSLGPSWRNARPVSRSMLWLLRWLLFRVVFVSGYVKLASGDKTWADYTALQYHYWTQPLPHVLAWSVAQLPAAFHSMSVRAMLAIELFAAWLIFAPRRLRFVAAAAIAVLMAAISASGNYGFFTLLTLTLCVTLLDDRALRSWLPGKTVPGDFSSVGRSDPVPGDFSTTGRRGQLVRKHLVPSDRAPIGVRAGMLTAFALCVFVITATSTLLRTRLITSAPAPIEAVMAATDPLRSFNDYGLFAVMTTTRPEIVVEGSDDGISWRPYEFRWKPGSIDRAPGFAALHMPRLDWQMWFAALGDWRSNPWYLQFVERLLQGSPVVTAQLATNPFPAHPPRYIRSTVYQYTFTTREQRAATGNWWNREFAGEYCPTLQLVDGKLAAVDR
jgi:hypothetical protein